MLRTPSVTDSSGGARSEKQATERGQMVKTADQVVQLAFENGLKVSPAIEKSLLPTPRAQNPGSTSVGYGDSLNDVANRFANGFAPKDLLPTPAVGHIRNHDEPIENYLQRRQDYVEGRTKGMPGASLGVAVRMDTQPELLPTPQALEGFNGNNLTVAHREAQGRQVMLSNHAVDLAMLPTPLVDDAKNSGQNQTRRGTLASEVYGGNDSTNWGKFEPAIRRWEQIFGHPAPAPTKPDGKDGAHRLSAEFTEWMMGLVPGWITGADISRAEALKAAGNGVVPQQAELALRQLLQGIDLIPKNVAPSD